MQQQSNEVSVHSALSSEFWIAFFPVVFALTSKGFGFLMYVYYTVPVLTGARTITIHPSNTSVVRTYLFTQLDNTHSYTVGATVTFTVTVTFTITFTCITTIGSHLQEQLCLHSCESETNEKRVV